VASVPVAVASTGLQSTGYSTQSTGLQSTGYNTQSTGLQSSGLQSTGYSTNAIQTNGLHDSRDVNYDGHVSLKEKALHGAVMTDEEQVMRLHEEQLAISKREVGAGEVGIHKRVEAERVEQTVALRREEVVVERRPLSGIADPNARIMEQDEILRVPLHREEVIMEKRVVPTEEVIVRKKEVIENQTVGATLRSEYVDTVQTQAISQNASLTGAYSDSRDLNRDGHISMGEKLKTAPDMNGDGRVSMAEKAQGALGTNNIKAARG